MQVIKRIFPFDENILITDEENKLWIMGENKYKRTGFGEVNKSIYSPIYSEIILEPEENVSKFYVYESLLAIYTTNGRLFISNDNKNVNSSDAILLRPTESQSTHQTNHAIPLRSNDARDLSSYEDVSDIEESTERNHSSIYEDNLSEDIDEIESTEHINSNNYEEYSDTISKFNNHDFYYSLYKKALIKDSKKEGMDLLEEGLRDVIFVAETIFFKKNEEIYVFNKKMIPKLTIYGNLGISTILIEKNNYVYYKLVFPFDYEKLVFKDNFVYVRSGQYHHVISTYDSLDIDVVLLSWIYFKCDIEITENDIYNIENEASVYVKHSNGVYKYFHETKDLQKIIGNDSRTIIVPSNNGIDNKLFSIKNEGVYYDNGNLHKIMECNELIPYVIDINLFDFNQLIIVDIDNSKRYIRKGSSLFFNIHDLLYYKLIDGGILYYDTNNTLYYLTNTILAENIYNTIEIEKIETDDEDTFYVYMFNNLPTPVSNIHFTNNLIILKSNNKYYYHTIDTRNFRVDKFTELTVKNDINSIELVQKHYVIRIKKEFENTVSLSININANKLEKFMIIIDLLRDKNNFEINFMEGTKIVSYGDGAKREFMEAAISYFANTYFIQYNRCCEFNLDKMKRFTEDELIIIGSMLHAVICHSNNHLSIRLPLQLISSILGKKPTIIELEYFVKMEDPEAFASLYPHKNNLNNIKNFGYDTYEECLNSLCKFYHNKDTNETVENISKLISKGFHDYHDVKNFSVMNLPTLDYFLSGDYELNRELLIKNLRIFNYPETTNNYKNIIISIIKSLSEDKLTMLIKNWSGTSIVKKSFTYNIYIENKESYDIYFATCSVDMTISQKILENSETSKLLIDLLTTPINFMFDPDL